MVSGMIRILFGLGKPHPLRGEYGTQYHFSIISLMIPMAAVGSSLATSVSKVIPDLYITVSYVLILSFVLAYNIYRLIMIVKKEAGKAPTDEAAKGTSTQGTASFDVTQKDKVPEASEKGNNNLEIEVTKP